MSDSIVHIGTADIHDGTILSVLTPSSSELLVVVQGFSGQRYEFSFTSVSAIESVDPVGMMLYAVSELPRQGASRRFVFTNWDEDGSAALSVVAGDMSFRAVGPAA